MLLNVQIVLYIRIGSLISSRGVSVSDHAMRSTVDERCRCWQFETNALGTGTTRSSVSSAEQLRVTIQLYTG